MVRHTGKTLSLALLAGALLLSPAAAQAQNRSFIVTLTNLTNPGIDSGQPFSPAVFATHDASLSFWDQGAPAGFGLQQIAEEGNNAPFLADLGLAGSAVGTTQTLGGPLMPGQSISFFLDTDASHPFLSSVWMLGRTNDGFSGNRSLDLFSISSPLTLDLFALDAGTEVNNEQNAYLPARGGAFNDPENGVVDIHPGLRGSSDPTSDVPDSWKWNGAVARLTINAAPEPGTLSLLLLTPVALLLGRKRTSS